MQQKPIKASLFYFFFGTKIFFLYYFKLKTLSTMLGSRLGHYLYLHCGFYIFSWNENVKHKKKQNVP